MNNIAQILLLVSVLTVSGCASRTAEQPDSLQQAVQDMTDFMRDNPDRLTDTGPAEEDQGFSGQAVKKGTFENLNYMSSGSAEIQTVDGKHFVVFGDDFSTPAGPDLVVYLTKNLGPTERADIQAGIELGELKSTAGKQVFEIPQGIDISEYFSVTIHCRAFNVPWSYAPLKAGSIS